MSEAHEDPALIEVPLLKKTRNPSNSMMEYFKTCIDKTGKF